MRIVLCSRELVEVREVTVDAGCKSPEAARTSHSNQSFNFIEAPINV